MFGLFKSCRLARMSSGRYCVVRDLGLVKGGKGMRHHELVIAFSLREALRWLRQPSAARRFETEASSDLIRGTNPYRISWRGYFPAVFCLPPSTSRPNVRPGNPAASK
jgi:hypothetical protein